MSIPPASFYTRQLFTAALFNSNLRDNLNTLNGAGLVPVGLVLPWGGPISGIPSGWGLCDGGSGRIDLRDVFVMGAGGAHAVAASGGAASATPSAHSGHTVTQPAHNDPHVIGDTPHGHSTPPAQVGPGSDFYAGLVPATHGPANLSSNNHGHANAALDSAGTVHGHGSGVATLPPYHARPYMQKVSSGLSFTTPITWTSGEVPTAAQLNADLRDNINYLAALVVPVGATAIWGFYADSIPTGWVLCDGTNGTPDLRDKFIVGAGSSYAVSATGGSATATLPAHTPHTPTQADNHGNHTVTQPADHGRQQARQVIGTPGNIVTLGASGDHTAWGIDAHTAHASFNVGGHSNHTAMNTLPPYYAAVYMQFVGATPLTSPRTWTTGETVQAVEVDTYLRDNENAINAAQFPISACALWSGSVASIPPGYSLIAAFEDKFIPGAGNGADGHYVPAATGGATALTPDPHTNHSVTQPMPHGSHVVTQPADHAVQNIDWAGAGGPITDYLTTGTHALTVDPHTPHAFTVDPHSDHSSISLLPPFKAYPYIQRAA